MLTKPVANATQQNNGFVLTEEYLRKKGQRKQATLIKAKKLLLHIGRYHLNTKIYNSCLAALKCCTVKIKDHQGRYKANYCNASFCNVCNRIRASKFFEQYLPVARESLTDPHFVTLNAKSPTREKLKEHWALMRKFIRDVSRNRIKQGNLLYGLSWSGFWKKECTFNTSKRTYNPHLHFYMEGKESAHALRLLWKRFCKKNKMKYVDRVADEVKEKAIDKFKDAMSYCVKDFVKGEDGKLKSIPTGAMFDMYDLMAGEKKVQPFGKLRENARLAKAAKVLNNEKLEVEAQFSTLKKKNSVFVWGEKEGQYGWRDNLTREELLNELDHKSTIEKIFKGKAAASTPEIPTITRKNWSNYFLSPYKEEEVLAALTRDLRLHAPHSEEAKHATNPHEQRELKEALNTGSTQGYNSLFQEAMEENKHYQSIYTEVFEPAKKREILKETEVYLQEERAMKAAFLKAKRREKKAEKAGGLAGLAALLFEGAGLSEPCEDIFPLVP